MTENIIIPAPAQVSINNNSKRNDEIKDLKQLLNSINIITRSINQYAQFQQSMDPKLQMLINTNHCLILILAAKGGITTYMENLYSTIENPPDDLIELMDDFRSDLDKISDTFIDSISQIKDLLQTQIFPNNTK